MKPLVDREERFILRAEKLNKLFFVVCVLMVLMVFLNAWICVNTIFQNLNNQKYVGEEIKQIALWVTVAVLIIQSMLNEKKFLKIVEKLRSEEKTVEEKEPA